ncbi:hypothetical protein CDD83_1746 [Cordyceps sp. RAO-2017]|nr:hypothetical protein CDD83_1746 [Cordyceps sp. RAO-2017]
MPTLYTTILVTSAGTAIFYGLRIRTPANLTRMVLKAASTALLSLLAAVHGTSWLLVAALAFGAGGDAFLAWPGETTFLCGLGSFLIAHLLYIAVFVQIGSGMDLIVAEGWRRVCAVMVSVLAPAMSLILVRRVGTSLRLPIVIYSTAILFMVLCSLTTPTQDVVMGALCFAISDTFLAADEFLVATESRHRTWMQHTVWILYYGGQVLLATGLLQADARSL